MPNSTHLQYLWIHTDAVIKAHAKWCSWAYCICLSNRCYRRNKRQVIILDNIKTNGENSLSIHLIAALNVKPFPSHSLKGVSFALLSCFSARFTELAVGQANDDNCRCVGFILCQSVIWLPFISLLVWKTLVQLWMNEAAMEDDTDRSCCRNDLLAWCTLKYTYSYTNMIIKVLLIIPVPKKQLTCMVTSKCKYFYRMHAKLSTC